MAFFVGIDVSKAKLSCFALLDERTGKGRSKTVLNGSGGYQVLLDWVGRYRPSGGDELVFVMEATGRYHQACALALSDAGHGVVIANPKRSRAFAEALDMLNKTDTVDARVLALYGARQDPKRWQPPAIEVRQLQALLGRLKALEKDLRREQNRLEGLQNQAPAVVRSLRDHIGYLSQARDELLTAISEHIKGHPELRRTHRHLLSIDGVGDKTAARLTALFMAHEFHSARQAAAFCGLVPRHFQSGTCLKFARLTKGGQPELRASLYMCAVCCIQHNADIRAFYMRLLRAGKPKMKALIAAMRKLVHIAFGVYRHGQPYRPKVNIA
jgi:transposase